MPSVANKGRLVNFITGITGVAPGGQAVLNNPVNLRYHRMILNCAALNYGGSKQDPLASASTGGGAFSGTLTGVALTNITGAGTGGTADLTVVNGQITAAVVNAAGTGYVTGNTATPVDATGVGAVLTLTASGGAITGIAVSNGGTPSPINPAMFFGSIKQVVNGINMRDIIPLNTQAIVDSLMPTLPTPLGVLPIYYTEPWRNLLNHNEIMSWDMFGQSTYQMQFGIASGLVNPSLTGWYEFDYMRNVRPGNQGQDVPFLQPLSQHQFSWPVVGGRNDINQLPFSYPIARLWLRLSAGNITQLEVYQDNNKVYEATAAQNAQQLWDMGINIGQQSGQAQGSGFPTPYKNGAQTAGNDFGNKFPADFNPITHFNAAFVADPDNRPWKALKCFNSLILRVFTDQAATLTIVEEMLPGAFAA